MTALAVFRPTCAVCFKLCWLKCVLLLCTYSANMTWLPVSTAFCAFATCIVCAFHPGSFQKLPFSLSSASRRTYCKMGNPSPKHISVTAHRLACIKGGHWANVLQLAKTCALRQNYVRPRKFFEIDLIECVASRPWHIFSKNALASLQYVNGQF